MAIGPKLRPGTHDKKVTTNKQGQGQMKVIKHQPKQKGILWENLKTFSKIWQKSEFYQIFQNLTLT